MGTADLILLPRSFQEDRLYSEPDFRLPVGLLVWCGVRCLLGRSFGDVANVSTYNPADKRLLKPSMNLLVKARTCIGRKPTQDRHSGLKGV